MPHNFRTLREASNYLNRNNYNNAAIFIGDESIPVNKRKYNIDLPNVTITPKKYDSSFDGSLENFTNTINAMTGGAINRLSATQNARALYDTYKLAAGDMNTQNYINSLVYGNNGIVSDKYAQEHPIMAILANTVGDIAPIGSIASSTYRNLRNANRTFSQVADRAIDRRTLPALYSPVERRLAARTRGQIVPSTGKTFNLPDKKVEDAKAFLAKFNKWNRHYGYPTIHPRTANNPALMDELIKERLLEHNTFARGVRDKPDFIKSTNEKLEALGIEPTSENRMKYYATHYAPQTGSGRTGVPKDTNTIYTSNSLDTALGYAEPQHGNEIGTPGEIAIVRRPIDFSGNREDWLRNGDFVLRNMRLPNNELFYRYALPYLLKTGNMPSKTLTDADYTKIKDIVNEKLNSVYGIINKKPDNETISYNNMQNRNYNEYALKNSNVSLKRLNRQLNGLDAMNKDLGTNIIFPHNRSLGSALNRFNTRQISNYFGDVKNTYLSRYNPIDDINVTNVADYLEHMRGNPYFSKRIELDDVSKAQLKEVAEEVAKNKFNPYKLSRKRQREMKEIKNFSKKEYRKALINQRRFTENDYKQLLKDNNIEPFDIDANNPIYTSEDLKPTTRNIGDPYQHIILTGEKGDKGIEFVKFIHPDVYKNEQNIKYSTRMHVGRYTPGLSRKSRRYGGLTRRYIK